MLVLAQLVEGILKKIISLKSTLNDDFQNTKRVPINNLTLKIQKTFVAAALMNASPFTESKWRFLSISNRKENTANETPCSLLTMIFAHKNILVCSRYEGNGLHGTCFRWYLGNRCVARNYFCYLIS